MFCDKCGGLRSSHTKEGCSGIRKETKEQNKPQPSPYDKLDAKLPQGEGGKTPVIIIYFRYAVHMLPNLRIYRAKVIHIEGMRDFTHVQIDKNAEFFNGIYIPRRINPTYKTIKETVSAMTRLALSVGAFYHNKTKIDTKLSYGFLTNYLTFCQNSFGDVKPGLEQKLMREWHLDKDDCEEIVDAVKNSLFTFQQ